jgi:hypothetical protein
MPIAAARCEAKATAMLLADLGVTKSHSRPHTSNDNPFSESHFKTMKYQPQFPQRFGCIQDAKTFCRSFFDWYNLDHHHAGIGLMTPDQMHYGRRPSPRRSSNHARWRLQQNPRALRQKATRTTGKADRNLDQSTEPTASRPSLNTKLYCCLRIVDTFRHACFAEWFFGNTHKARRFWRGPKWWKVRLLCFAAC